MKFLIFDQQHSLCIAMCVFLFLSTHTLYAQGIVNADTSICQGDTLILEATGGDFYEWSPYYSIMDIDSANSIVHPSMTTIYTVTISDSTGVVAVDSILVEVFNAAVAVNHIGCSGNDGSIALSHTGATPPVNVNWSTGATTPNISGLTAGAYSYTISDGQGCARIDTISIVPSNDLRLGGSRDAICPGDQIQIGSNVLPGSGACEGVDSVGCTTLTTSTIGRNSTANFGLMTTFPTIYGNFYESARHQLLYRADELNDEGMRGGIINSIAFNIAELNGTTEYCEFTIMVRCIQDDEIASFYTGLFEVFSPKTVNIHAGWNEYTFDQPYSWDGISNLIVEVCFNNTTCSSSFTLNSNLYFTKTPYNSVVYYRMDGTTACNNTSITNISQERPNVRFGVCPNPYNSHISTFSWSPTAGIIDTNVLSPIVSPDTTTTYTLIISDSTGCSDTASFEVEVSGHLSAELGNDTTICTDSITLYPTVSGSNPSFSYTWSAGFDVIISNRFAPNPTFYLIDDALIVLDLHDSIGCSIQDTIAVELDSCGPTIAEEYNLVDNIELFPNPVQNLLTIISNNKLIRRVEVFSATGKLMEINPIVVNGKKILLNFSELNVGIYLVQVHTKGGVLTRKISVVK